MVKHKAHNFKNLEGSSSTASTSSRHTGSDRAAISVKARLNELRQAEPAEAAERKRVLADTANQPSIPPSVQRILGVDSTPLPAPRSRTRFRDRLRTPGPAPPSSWLAGDVSGATVPKSNPRSRKTQHDEYPEIGLHRFRKLYTADAYAKTLTGMAMAKLALSWDILSLVDKRTLTTLPQRLRAELLSYLSHHRVGVTSADFGILTEGEDDILELDLGGLIGRSTLTLPALTTYLKLSTRAAVEEELVESWETSFNLSPISLNSSANFRTLTHLCLSHPPTTVRWRDLLGLTSRTPALTHLSLAWWPWPTLTPNLATATITTALGHSVNAGGSHIYSANDLDLGEPISLFRKLSSDLLSLRFLDIEGNHQWLAALACDRALPQYSITAEILLTNWRSLEKIYCGVFPPQYLARCESEALSHKPSRTGSWVMIEFSSVLHRIGGTMLLNHSFESWELAFWASRFISSRRQNAGAHRVIFDFGNQHR